MSNIMIDCLEDLLLKLKDSSIAVVGNAECKKQYGYYIDMHDAIFRFNEYEIENYEECVGTIVDYWIVTPYIRTNKNNHSVCLVPKKMGDQNMRLKNVTVIEPKDNCESELNELIEGYGVSTGLRFLYILNKLEIKADVYNFDHFETGEYFRSDDYEYSKNAHETDKEKMIASKLKYINFIGI